MGSEPPIVLVLTNAHDATADFFVQRLVDLGVSYRRLNTELLTHFGVSYRISHGEVSGRLMLGDHVDLRLVRSIYYRRPVLPVLSDAYDPSVARWIQNELQRCWGGILQSLVDAKWINHPLRISGASYKPEQLARATRMGLKVPDTLITSSPEEAETFCQDRDFAVIVKPLGHGEIRGDGVARDLLVYTNLLAPTDARDLASVRDCPTLFQAYVKKSYDLRVTVVEDRYFAVALHSQEQAKSQVDCRRDNMSGMQYSVEDLPKSVAEKLIALTRSYGLSFSAIDMAVDGHGRYWFFELNPAGQWAWLEQVVGVPISEALVQSLVGP